MNKIENDRILVTGANGQLGYDCIRELKKRGYRNICGIDRQELDITDRTSVIAFILKYQPNVIIHCAAWTAVDKAESFPDDVYKVNSLGTKYLAEASKMVDAKMVYISTDYVFDGLGNKPFEVDSPKYGLSVYGKTKSQGEDFVIAEVEKYFIVRISWAFGMNGSNFVKTMMKIADCGLKTIDVVSDQIGSVTYTVDLAVFLCDLIATEKYGIYHATNEGYISWYEFAKEIFKLMNKEIIINPISTIDYMNKFPGQADRPLNSRLSKDCLDRNGFNRLPNWKNALVRFLKELNEDVA